MIDLLEARGLVERRVAAHDRRVRLVHPTDEGRALLSKVVAPMFRSQELLLKPLSKQDRTELMRLINLVVQAHSDGTLSNGQSVENRMNAGFALCRACAPQAHVIA